MAHCKKKKNQTNKKEVVEEFRNKNQIRPTENRARWYKEIFISNYFKCK